MYRKTFILCRLHLVPYGDHRKEVKKRITTDSLFPGPTGIFWVAVALKGKASVQNYYTGTDTILFLFKLVILSFFHANSDSVMYHMRFGYLLIVWGAPNKINAK